MTRLHRPPTRSNARRALLCGLGALASCGPHAAPQPPAAADRIAIVVSERGDSGTRLVALDEHGDRQFALVQPASGAARDTNPAVSPDCKWIVFASSRGRSFD